MGLERDLETLIEFLTHPVPPPWVRHLDEKLDRIEILLKRGFEETGEQIMGLVTIDQDALNALGASVETAVGTINASVGDLTSAVGVLSGYITQLLANQAQPIPAADETAIAQALTDVSAAAASLSTATSGITALEPVSVTPVSPTPVSPTPVSPTPVSPTPVSPTPVSPTPVSPTPVSPTPVSPTPVSPAPVPPLPTPLDANALPVQAGTLDPSTQVVEVPQGVVPVVVPDGAILTLAGSLPADAWVAVVA